MVSKDIIKIENNIFTQGITIWTSGFKQKKKEIFQINFQINKTKPNKPSVVKHRCDYRKKKKNNGDNDQKSLKEVGKRKR